MELRARTRHLLRRAAPLAALGAVALVPATAGAATPKASAAKKRAKPPTIRSISPKQLSVGGTLTIRGRYFRAGRNKNTVLFKRDRGRAVFVKAGIGTKKMLKVKIPAKLEKSMIVIDGQPTATRFRLRVLTTRLGRKFTAAKMSPTVGPKVPDAPAGADRPKPGAPDGDCDGDKVLNGVDADDDNDLLTDDVELLYLLDPCKSDTDGDKVTDGYEYRSALDLNDDEHQTPNVFLPYPGKRPYPNPLDDSDAHTDFDGDSLTLLEEQSLWRYTIANGAPANLNALTYSDGEQYSQSIRNGAGRRQPTLEAAGYDKQERFREWAVGAGYWYVTLPGEASARPLLDVNRNGVIDDGDRDPDYPYSEASYLDTDEDGFLSDDERDEDADGLSNFVEAHGQLAQGWWQTWYPREKSFRITYAGTDLADWDTDGDGVRDGADDQDHDDIPNLVEISRKMVTGRPYDDPKTPKAATTNADGDPLNAPWYGRVQPFNPCLPDVNSRTCPRYIEVNGWAPFDGPPWSLEGDDPNYLVLN